MEYSIILRQEPKNLSLQEVSVTNFRDCKDLKKELKPDATSFMDSKTMQHHAKIEHEKFKRLVDVLVSLFGIILFFPLFILLAFTVPLTSYGTAFYSQERIGLNGKRFRIYKFRTMHLNAEAQGPELSGKGDKRITSFGKILRKTHLDELPQLYNVLCGEMSLVGPRPEREFYINKIIEYAPQYLKLQSVKPGLTSWGQIKFGYAQSIDEMLVRMKYDLQYLENKSLFTDFKIMLFTVKTIFECSGK